MTKIDTKEIRNTICEDGYDKSDLSNIALNLCDAYDEAQKEIKNLQTDLFAHATKSDKRISTLEELLRDVFREVLDSETNSINFSTFKRIQKELGEE